LRVEESDTIVLVFVSISGGVCATRVLHIDNGLSDLARRSLPKARWVAYSHL